MHLGFCQLALRRKTFFFFKMYFMRCTLWWVSVFTHFVDARKKKSCETVTLKLDSDDWFDGAVSRTFIKAVDLEERKKNRREAPTPVSDAPCICLNIVETGFAPFYIYVFICKLNYPPGAEYSYFIRNRSEKTYWSIKRFSERDSPK